MSSESNRYYEEYDYYNRIVADKLRDNSKHEMKRIYKKYRLNNKVLRAIVNLDFDLYLHFLVKVNSTMHNCNFHRG